MNSTSSLSKELRDWIQSELPQLQIPSLEALNFLTQGPAAEQLWKFIISRVRTQAHVNEIRSNINLSSSDIGFSTDGNYETELKRTRFEITQIENDISNLRSQILKNEKDKCSTRDINIEDGFNSLFRYSPDVPSREDVHNVLSNRITILINEKKQIINSIGGDLEQCIQSNFGSIEEETKDQISLRISQTLQDWFEQITTGQTIETKFGELDNRLRDLAKGSSPNQVVDCLKELAKTHTIDEPTDLTLHNVEEEDTTKVIKKYAQDRQLSAFGDLCTVEAEHDAIQNEITEELKQRKSIMSSQDFNELLTSVSRDGEQAFLEHIQKDWINNVPPDCVLIKTLDKISDITDIDVDDDEIGNVCLAVSKLFVGNQRLLQDTTKHHCKLDEDVKNTMTEELQEKLSTIHNWIDVLRKILQNQDLTICSNCETQESTDNLSIQSDIEKVRAKSVRKKLKKAKEELTEIKTKGDLVIEKKQSLERRSERDLNKKILEYHTTALECREQDAVMVRDELRNFIRQPGFAVAPQVRDDSCMSSR